VTHEIFGNKRMEKAFGTSGNKVRLIGMNNGSVEKFSETK